MSQMVLPQTPPQGPRPDSGAKQADGGREKNGDSRFDTVSRTEQQRLDNRQAEKREQARSDTVAGHNESGQKNPVRPGKAGDHGPEDRKQAAAVAETGSKPSGADVADAEGAETPEPALITLAPDGKLPLSAPIGQAPDGEDIELTFAGLQALSMPVKGSEAGALPAATGNNGAWTGVSGATPGVQAFAGLIDGLPGAIGNKFGPGKHPGLGVGQGAGAGLGLTEALMPGTAAEANRAQDTSLLQGALRFQAAAEVASQQLASPNTAKLPAEAAALRGYTTSIDVPVNHGDWGDKLVGKLTWLTARNMSVAEIHLTPPELGPMEVRVQVQQEQASITVHSANPAVRDQLELHSHRLRELLSEQGLSLDQFDVSDSPQQQTGEQSADAGADEASGNGGAAMAGAEDQDLQPQSLDLSWQGQVDIFA